MTKTPREELKDLSRLLSYVHKSLLHYQKQIYEGLEERKLSPHDLLGLLISHPDFEWLKIMSTLMVQIDEAVDDTEMELEKFQKEITNELQEIFIDPLKYTDFKNRIVQALSKDSHLFILLADLRKRILIETSAASPL